MAKIGRNVRCPCGSGKKYKHCCGSSAGSKRSSTQLNVEELRKLSSFEEMYSALGLPLSLPPARVDIDTVTNQVKINPAAEEILKLRFDQTFREREKDFDVKYSEEFYIISREYSQLEEVLNRVFQHVKDQETEQISAWFWPRGSIYVYVLDTIAASMDLARRGFRDQVCVLLRNAVEALATNLCLEVGAATETDLEAGKLKSSKAFTLLKNKVPEIGTLYGKVWGELSNNYVHLTSRHIDWGHLVPLIEPEAATAVIGFVKLLIVLTRIGMELVFYDFFPIRIFWTRTEPGRYDFGSAQEVRQCWIESLDVGIDMGPYV